MSSPFTVLSLLHDKLLTDTSGAQCYDTIWHAILTCARKLTSVSLIYRTQPTTEKWKKDKVKTDKLRSIGKQSAESVESVPKESFGSSMACSRKLKKYWRVWRECRRINGKLCHILTPSPSYTPRIQNTSSRKTAAAAVGWNCRLHSVVCRAMRYACLSAEEKSLLIICVAR